MRNEHELVVNRVDVKERMEYYGDFMILSDGYKCMKCGHYESYLGYKEKFEKAPCLPNRLAMGTWRRLRQLAYKIEQTNEEISQIQKACPHEFKDDDVLETCLACGKVSK